MVVSVGADRPGVMAALSGGLVELSCNLSDTQMAVLQGYASVMIVTDAPATLQADELQAALERGTEELGQTLWVYRLSELSATVAPGRRWSVSIHGADRPGVVYEITRLLADVNINIIDLQTRLSGPVGSLSMQVDVPASVDADEVASRVDRLADQLGMSCSIRPAST